MPGQSTSSPDEHLSLPPLEKLLQRLHHFPRLTKYQKFATNLGRLALDLLLPDHVGRGQGVTHLRDCATLPFGISTAMEQWVIEVTKENRLAGVVLTDALDYVTRMLHALGDRHSHVFPESDNKRNITQATGQYYIFFEVPPGWEIKEPRVN